MSHKIAGHNEKESNSTFTIKLQILHDLNKTIERDEIRLNNLYAQRKKLQHEIAITRLSQLSVPTTATTVSIKNLPVELIASIFEHSIPLDPVATHDIVTANTCRCALMLVCKSWNRIVLETPFLWSTIYLSIPCNCVDLLPWCMSVERYLHVCIDRSGSVPLDVIMDLSNILVGEGQAKEHVFRSWRQSEPEPEMLSFNKDMKDWLDEIDWEFCPAAIQCDQFHGKLIPRLVGPNSWIIPRLRTFQLILPKNIEASVKLWEIFTKTELLPTVVVSREGSASLASSMAGTLMDRLASSIREIGVYSFIIDDHDILAFSHLRRLKLWIILDDTYWEHLKALKDLPSLEELSMIIVDDDYDNSYSWPTSLPTITLHALRLLHLEGPVSPKVIKALEIERLGGLTLQEGIYSFESMPQARLFSIAESVVFGHPIDRPSDILARFLLSIISQLSIAHTIKAHPSIIELVLQQVEYCQCRGGLRSLIAVASL